jgi:hypothetical protein
MREQMTLVVAGGAALALAAVLMWPRLQQPAKAPRRPSPHTATASSGPVRKSSASGVAPLSSAVPSGARSSAPAPAAASSYPDYVEVDPAAAEQCPPDMLLVDGLYCPFVAHRCDEYVDGDSRAGGGEGDTRRCRRYRDELLCDGAPSRLHFCIDRYEYPNLEGVNPVVMVDYDQAGAACAAEGKRLCEHDEWSYACEGERTWPYPYGLERDPSACNIDRRMPTPDVQALSRPRDVAGEVARLDQRVASGALARCVSPFGVHDMTGNVDEWVHFRDGHERDKPYFSGLKGGHWGPIRARCRPMTTSHSRHFRFYQVGFRCCADARDGKPARKMLPRGARLPKKRKLTK